jgi:hypothetical protein
MVEHGRAQSIYRRRAQGPFSGHVLAKRVAQNREVAMTAPLGGLVLRFGVKALGFKKVGVDQAREQHADQKGLAEPLVGGPLPRPRRN